MKLPVKVLLLLISFNYRNIQAMNNNEHHSKRDCQDSSLCGDRIIEGGAGTYPELTEAELKLRAAKWDREHSVSWTAIFCSCFSPKNKSE